MILINNSLIVYKPNIKELAESKKFPIHFITIIHDYSFYFIKNPYLIINAYNTKKTINSTICINKNIYRAGWLSRYP